MEKQPHKKSEQAKLAPMVARLTGLEPAVSGIGIPHFIQLNYRRIFTAPVYSITYIFKCQAKRSCPRVFFLQ